MRRRRCDYKGDVDDVESVREGEDMVWYLLM